MFLPGPQPSSNKRCNSHFQLSWIMFCNRYRFALYRAQRKSKHAF